MLLCQIWLILINFILSRMRDKILFFVVWVSNFACIDAKSRHLEFQWLTDFE